MNRSQSAPSFPRAKSAPSSEQKALPSLARRPSSSGSQRQRHLSAGNQGLVPKNASDSMIKTLQMVASQRSSSPPRPGSTGNLSLSSSSRTLNPYLMSGLTNAVESHNCHSKVAQQKINERWLDATNAGLDTEDGKHAAITNEKDFAHATEGVEKRLKEVIHSLETFDPGNRGGQRGKIKRRSLEEDDDEEGEEMRARFEAYKMVRKIEPELPPLTPLPPVSTSVKLPHTPLIHYNYSEEAMQKCSVAARLRALKKRQVHGAEKRNAASYRRENMLEASRQIWEKALLQKRKQAEETIAARFAGTIKADMRKDVPVEVMAEKWSVVCALASFLNNAYEDVAFTHKPPEERKQIIAERQASGIVKRTDDFHLRAMQLDEYMKDESLTCRLFMFTRLFQSRARVRRMRKQAQVIRSCLANWKSTAGIFLKFHDFAGKIKYIQAWWRRTSRNLKDVRDEIARRWEKIEKFGTSGYHASIPHSKDVDIVDPVARNTFLEHELRARRFFVLARMSMWEEDAAKWRELHKHRKKFDAVDYDLVPYRPSYLPAGHLSSTEKHGDSEDVETWRQLGRRGDSEILAMIKAARSNPNGGGWKEIPQNVPGSPKNTKKVAFDGTDQSQADASVARLFGDVTPEDLEQWGVHPSNLPTIGQKPGADEGEGFYP